MSGNSLKVWPAAGRQVRDPVTGQPLTRRGATVPATTYWQRRLATGDVLDSPPSATPASKSNRRSRSAQRDSATKESHA